MARAQMATTCCSSSLYRQQQQRQYTSACMQAVQCALRAPCVAVVWSCCLRCFVHHCVFILFWFVPLRTCSYASCCVMSSKCGCGRQFCVRLSPCCGVRAMHVFGMHALHVLDAHVTAAVLRQTLTVLWGPLLQHGVLSACRAMHVDVDCWQLYGCSFGLHLVQQLLVVAALRVTADGLMQGYAVYCNPVA